MKRTLFFLLITLFVVGNFGFLHPIQGAPESSPQSILDSVSFTLNGQELLPEEIVIQLNSKYGLINHESKYIGQSYNSNGRVYVISQFLFEHLAFQGNYDPITKCMTLTSLITDDTLQFISGKEEVLVNGDPVPIDKLDMIRDMRMHFPIRFIGEYLGYTVTWDPAEEKVTLLWEAEDEY